MNMWQCIFLSIVMWIFIVSPLLFSWNDTLISDVGIFRFHFGCVAWLLSRSTVSYFFIPLWSHEKRCSCFQSTKYFDHKLLFLLFTFHTLKVCYLYVAYINTLNFHFVFSYSVFMNDEYTKAWCYTYIPMLHKWIYILGLHDKGKNFQYWY